MRRLLESLGSGEKQGLRRWLIHQSRGRVTHEIKLLDLWLLHQLQLPPDAVLWEALFPEKKGTPIHDIDLRRIKSRLATSLKKFLALQQIQQKKGELDLALIDRFLHRQQYDLFLRFYSAHLNKLNRVTVRSASYFQQRFELLSAYQSYLAFTGQDIGSNLIQELDACFELWHLHQRFFLAATNLGLSKSRNLSLHYLPGEVEFLKAIWWEGQTYLPLLSLYRQVILIISEPDQADLKHALQSLIEVKDHISLSQKSNFYRYLLNAGIRAVNKYADAVSSENLFALILTGIAENLIQDAHGKIPSMFFRAMIESCLRAEGKEKAEHYFQTFLPQIPEEDKNETEQFLKARLLLHQKRYVDLENHLKGIKFSRRGDQVRKRFFLLEAAFELRPEAVDDKILPEAKALKKHLQRNKEHLSSTLRDRYLHQIGWAIRFWEKYFDLPQLKSLEQEISQDAHHPFSAWLHHHIKERTTDLD